MARGYDDVHGIEYMDDDELAALVAQELEETPELDPELIEVEVRDGFVRLTGRVGSEHDAQVAEAILADLVGGGRYANDLVVDELVRAEYADAADVEAMEAAGEETRAATPERSSPEADHLVDDPEGDLYGTTDPHRAITRGQTYEPPTRPIQEGTGSREQH